MYDFSVAGGITALAIIGVGLLFLARLLLPSQESQQDNRDDSPSTTATRGTPLPWILGTRKVGAVVGWVGDLRTKTEEVGGKGSKQKITEYFEDRMDVLCIGVASSVEEIREGGEKIKGRFTRASNPSGTTITTSSGDSFKIYWGEKDQPINGRLAHSSRLGIKSRWPNICYIYWIQKDLGRNRRWEQIDYVVTRFCGEDLAEGIPETAGEGVNPMQAVSQALLAPYPHGVGLKANQVDFNSLKDTAEILRQEDVGANVLSVGSEAKSLVNNLLSDFGLLTPTYGGFLLFKAVRPKESVFLPNKALLPPAGEIEVNASSSKPTRAIFKFKDAAFRFRDTDIKIDDDGVANSAGAFVEESVNLSTVTDLGGASKVARRKMQEGLGEAIRSRFSAAFDAVHLLPGDVIRVEEFDAPFRVTSVEKTHLSDVVSLEVLLDNFGVPDTEDVQQNAGALGGGFSLLPDIDFTFFPKDDGIVVFRQRANPATDSAEILISRDDSTYVSVGFQNDSAHGGLLTTSLSASTSATITSGPKFEDGNGDAPLILDLSSDSTGFNAGRQLAVLEGSTNSEVVYLESVTVQGETAWTSNSVVAVDDFVVPATDPQGLRFIAVNGGTTGPTEPEWPFRIGERINDGSVRWEARGLEWQTNDIIRAKEGTSKQAFSAGDRIYVIPRQRLALFTQEIIETGQDLYVKSIPNSGFNIVDPSEVSAVVKTI